MLLLTTHNKLLDSKKLFKKRKEMIRYLDVIIDKSKEIRKNLRDDELGELSWGKRLTENDLQCSIWVMKINTDEIPNWKNLIGSEFDIQEDPIKYRESQKKS